MNILIICLLIAILLPYLAKIPVIKILQKEGGYNNHMPRWQADQLTDYGARAWGAHKNAFESLIIFTAAVSTALATNHVTVFIKVLAVSHIVCRVIYHFLYLMDLATARSLIWALGTLCSLIIIGACIQ